LRKFLAQGAPERGSFGHDTDPQYHQYMTDASINAGGFAHSTAKEKAKPVRLPAPQPLGAPVLIYDCVTPLGGETLLSLLMKRMMKDV